MRDVEKIVYQTEIFVLIMSPRYFETERCLKELHAAYESGKRVNT